MTLYFLEKSRYTWFYSDVNIFEFEFGFLSLTRFRGLILNEFGISKDSSYVQLIESKRFRKLDFIKVQRVRSPENLLSTHHY